AINVINVINAAAATVDGAMIGIVIAISGINAAAAGDMRQIVKSLKAFRRAKPFHQLSTPKPAAKEPNPPSKRCITAATARSAKGPPKRLAKAVDAVAAGGEGAVVAVVAVADRITVSTPRVTAASRTSRIAKAAAVVAAAATTAIAA